MVEPDTGGQAEQALQDTLAQAVQRTGAVALQGERALQAPEDRLDALADGGEVDTVVGFVGSGRTRQTVTV